MRSEMHQRGLLSEMPQVRAFLLSPFSKSWIYHWTSSDVILIVVVYVH
jgi:hypothetical protein